MNKYELISFDLCPFVQRSAITLLHKKVNFDINYVDLNDKPDWFLKISPLGKVPLLRVNEDDVLFESAVINEYIDEVTEGSLLPADPIERAKSRAWIQFSSTLLSDMFMVTVAMDAEDFNARSETFLARLQTLEQDFPGGDYFNGKDLNLVDTSFAPVFVRTVILNENFGTDFFAATPKVKAWAHNLVSLEAVIKSVKPGFPDRYHARLVDNDRYITR